MNANKCYASLDFSFPMPMLFLQGCRCKMSIWCTCPPLRGWRCKNLVVHMPSNGYVMMQMLFVGMSWCKCLFVGMPWYECPFVGMSWCKCPLVGMPWYKCPILGMSWCECFDANTIYSKILFVFKIKAPSAPEKYFWILICYSQKVIFFFFT